MLVHSFMRGSRNFRRGGRGKGPGQSENVFFSPQIILQESNGQFQRNLSFFKVREGSNILQGVQLFQGGGVSNCFFPIETHITCDSPGGGGGSGPPVPFWIRTCSFKA